MADMARARTTSVGSASPGQRMATGALAGVVGGLVFGVMMGMMGMLPMVAMLVGSQAAAVGFIVHLLISAINGLGFGLLFGNRIGTLQSGAIWGAVYGFAWWMLGPLLIMPTLMGMGPQFGMAYAPMNVMSLLGHLIYGIVTGLVYPLLARRLG